jgi:hypothetical protein
MHFSELSISLVIQGRIYFGPHGNVVDFCHKFYLSSTSKILTRILSNTTKILTKNHNYYDD